MWSKGQKNNEMNEIPIDTSQKEAKSQFPFEWVSNCSACLCLEGRILNSSGSRNDTLFQLSAVSGDFTTSFAISTFNSPNLRLYNMLFIQYKLFMLANGSEGVAFQGFKCATWIVLEICAGNELCNRYVWQNTVNILISPALKQRQVQRKRSKQQKKNFFFDWVNKSKPYKASWLLARNSVGFKHKGQHTGASRHSYCEV